MTATTAAAVVARPVAPSARLRILVADDSAAVIALLRGFLVREGHEVVVAADGGEALVQFERQRPDLVLMDVVMPTMDGIAATRRLREIAAGRWVPVILLSALDTEDDVVRALEAGGDDYLVKPINLSVLKAKIRSFQRIAVMQTQLVEQAARLERLSDERQMEEQVANALIGNMVRREGLNDPLLAWEVRPSSRFSGDAVAAVRASNGHLYAMLGDATGHGLTASVSLLPALQVFYGMAQKGLPLRAIVREINARLRDLLPVGRYLAAVLMLLDESARSLEIWNGGMPAALLLDGTGATVSTHPPAHVPLGILSEAEFDHRCDVLRWGDAGQIVVHSDGVTDCQNASGEPFGPERLHRSLRAALPEARAARVRDDLNDHLAGGTGFDDASVLTVLLR